MNEVTIRKANPGDAELLALLNADVQKLHAEAHPHLFKQPGTDDSIQRFMAEELAKSENYFFIAEVNHTPAAYIFAAILDRPENAFKYADRQMYINQISVRPEFQGLGCGHLLIEKVCSLAQENNIQVIGVDTWAFNEKGLAFFQAHGFVTNNIRMWRIQP